MTVAGHRHERIAEEIHHEVGAMLAGEMADPRLEVSIAVTEVRVTPDLKNVRIFVRVDAGDKERRAAMKGLEAATGFIRRELLERLRLRRSPELHFTLDSTDETAARIEQLLLQAKKSNSG
jgi:ribosome-binding factor A